MRDTTNKQSMVLCLHTWDKCVINFVDESGYLLKDENCKVYERGIIDNYVFSQSIKIMRGFENVRNGKAEV